MQHSNIEMFSRTRQGLSVVFFFCLFSFVVVLSLEAQN